MKRNTAPTLLALYTLCFFTTKEVLADKLVHDHPHNNLSQLIFDLPIESLGQIEIESASKHPETIAQAPVNMVVLTRSEIEAFGFTTFEELVAHFPGFYFVDTYEDLKTGLRGAIGGGILFLINGVPRHPARIKGLSMPERERYNIPISAIDRIEIIRGPMSVIYGHNAFLGAINIITNAKRSNSSQISATYGGHDTKQLEWRLTKTQQKNFGIIFNGMYVNTDGISGDLQNAMSIEQFSSVIPAMNHNLSQTLSKENLSLELYSYYKNVWLDCRLSSMEYGFYALSPSFRDGNRLKLSTTHATIGYTHTISDSISLDAQAHYSNELYQLAFDILADNDSSWQKQGAKRLEGELHVHIKPWNNASIVTGYRIQHIVNPKNDFELYPIDFGFHLASDSTLQNDLYMEFDQNFLHAFSINAGVRLSYITPYNLEAIFYSPQTRIITETQNITYNHQEELRVTPRFGITYSINNTNHLKLIYGEASENNLQFEFQELEKIQSLEVIYLYQSKHMYAQLSVYKSVIENLLRKFQYIDPVSNILVRDIDNSGRLETLGAEAFAGIAPTSNFHLYISLSWQETEDTNNPSIDVAYSPRWLAKVYMNYQVPLGTWGTLQLALANRYIGKMLPEWRWTDNKDEIERIGDEVGPYLIMTGNMRLQLHKSGFFTNLHLSNIFNIDYRYPANELVQFKHGSFSEGQLLMITLGLML